MSRRLRRVGLWSLLGFGSLISLFVGGVLYEDHERTQAMREAKHPAGKGL